MPGKRSLTKYLFALAVALLAAIFINASVYANDFPVNTTDDINDGACTTGHCSLREAIISANTTPGDDRIYFDMGDGLHRIELSENLPMITDNSTTIEGPHSSFDKVVLDGSTGAHVGLWLDSDANVVRYLTLVGFSNTGLAATGDYNLVEYNTFGIDPEGILANGNGMTVEGEANVATANVISGNRRAGINVVRASNALITGNMIGTDLSGTRDLGNQVGISVTLSESIRIGHAEMNPNLISGNDLYGISLTSGADGIKIVNNQIGTDLSGSSALPNGDGISVYYSGVIEIGGEGMAGNLIAGNSRNGIVVGTENRVTILGNEIGRERVPNGTGIYVSHAPGVVIGNDTAGNRINYNLGDGIFIYNGEHLTIFYNDIKHNRGKGIHVQRANETDRINIRWNNIGYNRGGKGIQFDEPGTNGGIQPPVLITLLTRSIVIGRTCPDCVIDVFRSDLDPSGYGEGFQYLVSGHANGSGVININVEGLTLCDSLTTTVTDLQSRTSEFSTNYRGIDCTIPPVVYPFLLVLTVLIGITTVPRIWHKPGSLPNILIGFVGIIAVISLVVGILFLRFGSLPVNPNGNIPVEEDVPLCQNLIDSEKLQPPLGAIFPVEQPPTIAWNLVNDPGLPGEIRWQVELINPVAERENRKIDTTNIPLTMFDIATDIVGTYRWRVWAEWLNPQSGEWQVFCDEPVYWLFTLGEEIPPLEYPPGETTKAATETPEDVKTETPEPQDETPVARALVNLNCRQGPSELYGLTGNFREGETAVIEGRNANNTWWYLRPPQVTVSCWVLGSGVEASGNLVNLPLVTAPLLPTLTFTPTFTPTVTPSQTPSLTPSVTVSAPQCGDFKTQNECNSHANDMQCYWSQKDVCVKQ